MEKDLSVSFVMPMFNERDNIRDTIAGIRKVAGEITRDYEIVIVDDASTDDSVDVVEAARAQDPSIRLIRMKKNTKFGGAFAAGFKGAEKDVIVYMDSDMPVSIDNIKASFPLIREADIVTGYSMIKKGDTVKRKIMSGVYNLMVRTLFGLNVRDVNSGYKIVRREAIRDLRFVSHSPFVDVELFLNAKKRRQKVRQYPLIFLSRSGGVSHISRLPVVLATFRDMLKVRVLSWLRR
ncbi:MAG: glycosyltransferase family 2 protein [Candidatus Omnitrophica bacterium]|nr:glycosyltransferase family 2 protein [Candidatus Omnitrophota bacterium]MDD5488460.1 glycosyltransferase family 2 protein [Candidatus Omnitrophota bacterium]